MTSFRLNKVIESYRIQADTIREVYTSLNKINRIIDNYQYCFARETARESVIRIIEKLSQQFSLDKMKDSSLDALKEAYSIVINCKYSVECHPSYLTRIDESTLAFDLDENTRLLFSETARRVTGDSLGKLCRIFESLEYVSKLKEVLDKMTTYSKQVCGGLDPKVLSQKLAEVFDTYDFKEILGTDRLRRELGVDTLESLSKRGITVSVAERLVEKARSLSQNPYSGANPIIAYILGGLGTELDVFRKTISEKCVRPGEIAEVGKSIDQILESTSRRLTVIRKILKTSLGVAPFRSEKIMTMDDLERLLEDLSKSGEALTQLCIKDKSFCDLLETLLKRVVGEEVDFVSLVREVAQDEDKLNKFIELCENKILLCKVSIG